jgi:hypothetical protein
MSSAVCDMFGVVTQVEQGIESLIGYDPDITATATIAT